jgi:hypothetical protein
MQMWRLFRPREYRGQNKRHGFLKEYKEPFDWAQGRREEKFCVSFRLLFLDVFLQEGLRELWLPVLRQAEFPQHFLSAVAFAEEDRRGRAFSVAP